jgi:hypothetical protein
MGKRKTKNNTAAPVEVAPQVNNTDKSEQNDAVSYVVVRDGLRVSDQTFDTPTHPMAVSEKEFWTRVSDFHSIGEKVEIIVYDSKKHRVW